MPFAEVWANRRCLAYHPHSGDGQDLCCSYVTSANFVLFQVNELIAPTKRWGPQNHSNNLFV